LLDLSTRYSNNTFSLGVTFMVFKQHLLSGWVGGRNIWEGKAQVVF
jgi:hypothetical protein